METTMKVMNPDTNITGTRSEQATKPPRPADTAPVLPSDDFVRRDEFRLLLWMGAFALTAVLGGMTFLYTAISDLRVAMAEEHAALRVFMAEERAGLRADMAEEHAALRADMKAQIKELRADMEAEHAVIRSDISNLRAEVVNLRERVIRIETHSGIEPVES